MPRKSIDVPIENTAEPTEAEVLASMEEPTPPEVAKNEDADESVPSDGDLIPVIPEREKKPVGELTNPEDRVEIDGQSFTKAELSQILKGRSREKLVLPKVEAKPGHMLLADCIIKLDKIGQSVAKQLITPAEAMLLTAEHHHNAGGHVIYNLEVKGQIKRTPANEARRLKSIYGENKVKAMFPGAIPQLPTTFAEGIVVGRETEIPTQALLEHKTFQ